VTTRRAFISALAGGLLAGPRIADAQQAAKVYRVGYLTAGSVTANPRALEAFRQGLRELGWVEGQNLVIEYRSGGGPLRPAARARSRIGPA
jgi:putative tryptophan/tyrosine transport system substrate-binding protein